MSTFEDLRTISFCLPIQGVFPIFIDRFPIRMKGKPGVQTVFTGKENRIEPEFPDILFQFVGREILHGGKFYCSVQHWSRKKIRSGVDERLVSVIDQISAVIVSRVHPLRLKLIDCL